MIETSPDICELSDALREIERLQIELRASQTGVAALQGTVERLKAEIEQLRNEQVANSGSESGKFENS